MYNNYIFSYLYHYSIFTKANLLNLLNKLISRSSYNIAVDVVVGFLENRESDKFIIDEILKTKDPTKDNPDIYGNKSSNDSPNNNPRNNNPRNNNPRNNNQNNNQNNRSYNNYPENGSRNNNQNNNSDNNQYDIQNNRPNNKFHNNNPNNKFHNNNSDNKFRNNNPNNKSNNNPNNKSNNNPNNQNKKHKIDGVVFTIVSYFKTFRNDNMLPSNNTDRLTYLDIGCFNGVKTIDVGKLLHLDSRNIYGIDIASYSGMPVKPLPGFTFKDYDGMNIPHRDNMFDFISILHTLHHVNTNVNILIKNIHRVLKKGGLIFIREHNKIDDISMYIYTVEHVLYSTLYDEGVSYDSFVKDYYERFYTRQELIKLFTDNNFVYCHMDNYLEDMKSSLGRNPNNSYNIVFQKV